MLHYFNQNLLRSTLLADGILSLAAGAGLLSLAAPVAALAGPAASPAIVASIGAGLLLWGTFHLVMGRQAQPSRSAVRIAITGDLLWVLASLMLLVLARDAFSTAGLIIVAVAMVGVADLMLLKMKGLSRQSAHMA